MSILIPYLRSTVSLFKDWGRVPCSLLFSKFLSEDVNERLQKFIFHQICKKKYPKIHREYTEAYVTYNTRRFFNSPKLSGSIPSKLLFFKSLQVTGEKYKMQYIIDTNFCIFTLEKTKI